MKRRQGMSVMVLIPSYNTGAALLARTVEAALAQGYPVGVIIDGSTDGSDASLEGLCAQWPSLEVWRLDRNQGKGAAVLVGLQKALALGHTHVLTCDADGQHPVEAIAHFVALSQAHPEAALMGRPVFGPEAPALRVRGRMISNGWTWIETLGWGVGDSLFGMRLYPAAALKAAFEQTSFARRFDYDTEIAVRLAWAGVPMIQVPTAVRYLTTAEGGVSQFRYLRDNAVLSWMHTRLVFGFLWRLPWLLWRRMHSAASQSTATAPLSSS